MNIALVLLLVCGLLGLFTVQRGRRAYLIPMIGAVLVGGLFYTFPSLM